MDQHTRRVLAGLTGGAATLLVAAAMVGAPAHAEDTTGEPDSTPGAGASAEPTGTPADATTTTPAADPSGSTAPEDPSGEEGEETEEPEPTEAADLTVAVPGDWVTVGSGGKWVRIDVNNHGPSSAENVVVTIEVAEHSDTVEIELPGEDQGCAVDGDTAVCQYPNLDDSDVDTFVAFKVTPTDDAVEGDAGRVDVGVASDTPDPVPANDNAEVNLRVVGSGVDFTAFAAPVGPVEPGTSEELAIGFLNQGDETAPGWGFTVSVPPYARLVGDYEECTHNRADLSVTCTVPGDPVVPGDGFDLSGAFQVAVSKRAPGPIVLGRGEFTITPVESPVSATKHDGAGGLRAAARKTSDMGSMNAPDVNERDNLVEFAVKAAKNPADLAAIGAKLTGQVDDTVTAKVGARNRGPADTVGPGQGVSVGKLTVTVPAGTEVTGAPDRCRPLVDGKPDYENEGQPGAEAYECFPPVHLEAGVKALLTFELKITNAVVGDGKVEVEGGELDDEPANNTAKIQVTIGTGGSGGGGGGGGLPVTGAGLSGVIGGGAVAILLGGAIYLVSRRRRTAQESEENAAA